MRLGQPAQRLDRLARAEQAALLQHMADDHDDRQHRRRHQVAGRPGGDQRQRDQPVGDAVQARVAQAVPGGGRARAPRPAAPPRRRPGRDSGLLSGNHDLPQPPRAPAARRRAWPASAAAPSSSRARPAPAAARRPPVPRQAPYAERRSGAHGGAAGSAAGSDPARRPARSTAVTLADLAQHGGDAGRDRPGRAAPAGSPGSSLACQGGDGGACGARLATRSSAAAARLVSMPVPLALGRLHGARRPRCARRRCPARPSGRDQHRVEGDLRLRRQQRVEVDPRSPRRRAARPVLRSAGRRRLIAVTRSPRSACRLRLRHRARTSASWPGRTTRKSSIERAAARP